MDELVQPEDRDYVLALARQVLALRTPVRWLIRDVWDVHAWLMYVEPVIGPIRHLPLAVATLRPVCQLIFELSRRQRQILRELTRCCCTKKLAATLGISDATIRSHLSRAQLAAQCSDLTELMRWANDMQHAFAVEEEIATYLARRQR